MVTNWDFRGKWVGTYRYDPNPLFTQPMPVVPFTLTLKKTWFGKLRGQVQDDLATGMPEVGMVQGKVTGLDVEFVKLMPVCYVNLNGKMVRYSQHLGLDYELPHPEIHYLGKYSQADDTVSGTWCIEPRKIRLEVGGSERNAKFAGVTGTWEIRRQAEL